MLGLLVFIGLAMTSFLSGGRRISIKHELLVGPCRARPLHCPSLHVPRWMACEPSWGEEGASNPIAAICVV